MNNKEMFFDSMAYKWDETVNHDSNKIRAVLELLEIKSRDSVLDIGTGTGVLIPFLLDSLRENGHITAIDMSVRMLSVAESKYKSSQVRFYKLNFMEDELEETFDIILCYSCFPHLDDKRMAIKRMLKVLKKGGKLVIFHSESRGEINRLHMNMDNPVKHDKLPAATYLKSIIESEGGRVVYTEDSEDKYVIISSI